MPCDTPRLAYPTAEGGRYSFTRPVGHSGRSVSVPCRQCVGCKLDRAGGWAIRLVGESRCWPLLSSWFVTFTQDEEHASWRSPVSPCDYRNIIRRLQRALPRATPGPMRQLGIGEYGSTTGRAHYHAGLFNLALPDITYYRSNDHGDRCYISDTLSAAYGRGKVELSPLDAGNALYLAGYMLRKISPEAVPLLVDDATGEVLERHPPFMRCSMKPGIGAGFVKRFAPELLREGTAMRGGHEVAAPPYILRKLEELDPAGVERIKERRREFAMSDRAKDSRRPMRVYARVVNRDQKLQLGRRASRVPV